MDLPFDLSVALGLLDAGEDDGIITPYSYREAVVTKYLGKLFGCSNRGLVVGDYLYPLLLRCLAVGRTFGEPEGHQPKAGQLANSPG
jgi:hypothetical protein